MYLQHPAIIWKAVKTTLSFTSSWICEDGFSALVEIRSKKGKEFLVLILKHEQAWRHCSLASVWLFSKAVTVIPEEN